MEAWGLENLSDLTNQTAFKQQFCYSSINLIPTLRFFAVHHTISLWSQVGEKFQKTLKKFSRKEHFWEHFVKSNKVLDILPVNLQAER